MSTQLANPKDLLFPYQRRWVDDKSRFKIGCWARQTGKDFSTGCEIAEDMIANPNTEWMIVAPSERQSIESLDKVKKWLQAFDIAFEDEIFELDEDDIKATGVKLANGSKCYAVPGKPATVRGPSANVLFTEFSFFEQPEETWKALAPIISNPLKGGQKKVRAISTPNGKTGQGQRFYEILKENYFEPVEGRKNVWSVHYVPLKAAIAEGLPVDYDELAAFLGDPVTQAQELDLEFLDGVYQLLTFDMVNAAESRDATTTPELDYWENTMETVFLGVDFGRTEDPTVCWACALIGDVLVTREILVMRDTSSVEQLEQLRKRFRKATRVCYDYTGPGIGLGDFIVKEFGEWSPSSHKMGKVELCNFSAPFKRLLFPPLHQRFESPCRVRIPAGDAELRNDLFAMQQVVKGGAFYYDSPRTKDGHSDRCVALALCNRAAGDGGGIIMAPDPVTTYSNNGGSAYAPNNATLSTRPF